MPCIDTLQTRNPFREKAQVGAVVHVWAPRRSQSNPYSTRTFFHSGATTFSTLLNGARCHGNPPKDKNSCWTQNTCIVGEDPEGRTPFVGYSFAPTLEQAIVEFERLQAHIAQLPAVETPIKDIAAKLKTLAEAQHCLPALDQNQYLPRKERAKLLREFFKKQAILGITVKTDRYANATAVTMKFPEKSRDYPEYEETYKNLQHKILPALFPGNKNRPDPGSDYYGHIAWSIH